MIRKESQIALKRREIFHSPRRSTAEVTHRHAIVDRLNGFDATLWQKGEKAGRITQIRHALRRLRNRERELEHISKGKTIYLTGKETVPIQIEVHEGEKMDRIKAQVEIENLSKAVRPKEKTARKKDRPAREANRQTRVMEPGAEAVLRQTKRKVKE